MTVHLIVESTYTVHLPCTVYQYDPPHPSPDWPTIIPNDGLIIVNQSMRRDCSTCKMSSSSIPRISNVIVISVQPERNIQLFPNNGMLINYIVVLIHTCTCIRACTCSSSNTYCIIGDARFYRGQAATLIHV